MCVAQRALGANPPWIGGLGGICPSFAPRRRVEALVGGRARLAGPARPAHGAVPAHEAVPAHGMRSLKSDF